MTLCSGNSAQVIWPKPKPSLSKSLANKIQINKVEIQQSKENTDTVVACRTAQPWKQKKQGSAQQQRESKHQVVVVASKVHCA
jgi:hypothetical protein